MRITEKIRNRIADTDRITKNIFRVYLPVLDFFLSVILTVVAFYRQLFPDYDTAEYWVIEILKLFSGITAAVIIPVLMFEIMCRVFGLNKE